ncbi:MAG: DNA gyrase subunit A [Chloroflexi bacterium]|nr:DNA gyrase subunit A [Chloroflexota bacterium]
MVRAEEAIRPPRPRDIETEMRTSYLDYAMSVIVARALPDVRDGLKPVQRRILFAMDDLGLRSGAAFKKSARIIGEVLGKYHPHGDSPVYEAMVRMAQDFSLRYALVDGQGNFGSIDADPPAAMRYTEARLSQIAEEMLADLDKQTVDFAPNFDSSLNEPTVLPGRLPNLLVNGAQGIAVGMATNIPPHHLGEIGAAVKLVLANPEAGVDELMEVVEAPDFPSGGLLFAGEGRSAVREIFGTGHGRITLRAVHHTEETARGGRIQIVFTELPYQVNKAALIEQIANHVRDKRIDGIADLRDESDRDGLRVVVELKRDGNLQLALAFLWKLTPLQTNYAANMVALIDGRPRAISLKQAIEAYIDHRRDVIRRRSEFDLEKARDRHHVVEGLLKAIGMIDEIIAAIRRAESADAAKSRLQRAPFGLSERQAQAVLDMQLRRLAALERTKLEEEYNELSETIAYLEGLLADPKKIDGVIAEDVDELTERFAGERRSKVVERDAESFSPEDLVAHEETVISYSRGGYIKRMPLATYRTQNRGGKGVKAMQTRPEDAVRELLVADTHDSLLLFSDRGRVFSLKAHEVEERTREWRGLPIRNLVQVEPEERITAMVAAPELDHDYLLLATRDGQIKKTALKEFADVRRAGLKAFNLRNGDELVLATTAHAGDDVMVASDAGLAVRFPVDALREASRSSGGVRAITLPKDGRLVGLLKVAPDQELLTVTANGFGKRTPESEYPRKGRGGKGMIAHKVSDRTGALVSLHQVAGDEQLVLISEEGKFIRTAVDSIRACGRSTQGVTVMKTDAGMDVAAVAVVRPSAWEGSAGPQAPANGGREGKPASAPRRASSRNGAARNGAGSGRRRNGR